jgi:hypothetical protein
VFPRLPVRPTEHVAGGASFVLDSFLVVVGQAQRHINLSDYDLADPVEAA